MYIFHRYPGISKFTKSARGVECTLPKASVCGISNYFNLVSLYSNNKSLGADHACTCIVILISENSQWFQTRTIPIVIWYNFPVLMREEYSHPARSGWGYWQELEMWKLSLMGAFKPLLSGFIVVWSWGCWKHFFWFTSTLFHILIKKKWITNDFLVLPINSVKKGWTRSCFAYRFKLNLSFHLAPRGFSLLPGYVAQWSDLI